MANRFNGELTPLQIYNIQVRAGLKAVGHPMSNKKYPTPTWEEVQKSQPLKAKECEEMAKLINKAIKEGKDAAD